MKSPKASDARLAALNAKIAESAGRQTDEALCAEERSLLAQLALVREAKKAGSHGIVRLIIGLPLVDD